MTRRTRVAVPLLLALAISACGDGSPDNNPSGPSISTLVAQTTNQDTPTMSQSFTVNDSDGLTGLTLNVASSDRSVVPIGNIVLSGSGANRSVVVTPVADATGAVVITITATDAQGRTAQEGFRVTVNAVPASFKDLALAAYAKDRNDTPVDVRGKTYTQDADDPAAFSALLQ